MDIHYTTEEGGKWYGHSLPFGRLRLFLYLRKVELGVPFLKGPAPGFPFCFHSLRIMSSGKEWDSINGWRTGPRDKYLVWRARRSSRRLQKR